MKATLTAYHFVKFIFFWLIIFQSILLSGQNDKGLNPINRNSNFDTSGATYAIIIGISEYKNIVDLQFADKDALAFRSYLLGNRNDHLDSSNIVTFINEEATKLNITSAIYDIVGKAKPKDKFIFYFGGHGDIEDMSNENNGLLLLHDSPDGNYFSDLHEVLEIKRLSDFISILSQKKEVNVLYVIDACHSGKLKGGVEGRIHTGKAIKTITAEETAILSCEANQISIEGIDWGGGRGLFSYFLEEGLLGFANKNSDDNITFLELEDYVSDKVIQHSDEEQTPVFIGGNKKIVMSNINGQQFDSLKLKKQRELTTYTEVSLKGREQDLVRNLKQENLLTYNLYKQEYENNRILFPYTESALKKFRELENKIPQHELLSLLKRQLISKLSFSCDSIIARINIGKGMRVKKEKLLLILTQLDSCIILLPKDHFYHQSLLSKKYFINALIEKGNIEINNYQPSDKPQMKNCISLIKNAMDLEPKAGYLYYVMGISFLDMYEYDSSLVYLQKFLKLVPNSHVAHSDVGVALFNIGNTNEGIAMIKKSIDIEPTYANGLSNMAYVSNKIKNYKDAVYYSEKALKVKPNSYSAHINLSDAYMYNNELEKSIEILNKLLVLFPDLRYETHYYLADLYIRSNNYEDAYINALKCKNINPNSYDYYWILGNTLLCKKEYNDARSQLSIGYQLNPKDYDINEELGYTHKVLNNIDSANYYFNNSIDLLLSYREQTGKAQRLFKVANMYHYGINNYIKADSFYKESIKLDSLNNSYLAVAAINLLSLDRKVDAINLSNKLTNEKDTWFKYFKSILAIYNNDNKAALLYFNEIFTEQTISYKYLLHEKQTESFIEKNKDVVSKYMIKCGCKMP